MLELEDEQTQIAVVGSGSWGTALVKILMEQKRRIRWWIHREEDAKYVREHKHNPKYLTTVQIRPGKVKAYSDIDRAVSKAGIILVAVPSAYIPEVFSTVNPELLKNKIIISGTKGLVPSTGELVTDYLKRTFDLKEDQFVVIAGPCHAEEVAMERLSYLTLAGLSEYGTKIAADLLKCDYIKTSYHEDIYGAEYCAIIKNIIALASGICNGLNYGDNFQSVLVANGFREMKRFIDAAFPQHRQLIDTAYLGDLLVTAYSQFSRNRTFGNMIGRGYSVKSAQMEMNMVAEGYYAVKGIVEMNQRLAIDLPIIETVYSILYEHKSPTKAIALLQQKLD